MADRRKFAELKNPERVWAIASVHGEAGKLAEIHRQIEARLAEGDRVVYLGNLLGRSPGVRETVDEVLRFRTGFMARPGTFACDIALLRGGQEEMWQKLMQLQFATDPRGVLAWMLDQGLGHTLAAYGESESEAQRAAGGGPVALTRWTNRLRRAMQETPGHFQLLAELRRAAFTSDHSLLFVNAGLDPSRPLEAQLDSFWWSSGAFSKIEERYGDYNRVIRGFAPRHPGIEEKEFTLTLDAGAGFGGPLVAACIGADGALIETLEA